MSILLLVIGLLLFIGLVVVHEWGHFIMARHSGVDVEEFGIFFPPRLFKRRTKDGWLFTINLIPLGGFVKMKGEHDADTTKGSFGAASLWGKTKIMAAGVFMNAVVAYLLLVLVALVGMPSLVPNQFTVKSDTVQSKSEVFAGPIEKGSPADKAGLKSKDQLVSIGPPGQAATPIKSANVLPGLTSKYAGQTVIIKYIRDGHLASTKATLLGDTTVKKSQTIYNQAVKSTKLDCANINPPKGHLGIMPAEFTLRRSTWSAPIVAGGLMGQFTGLTFQGLGHAVAGLGGIIAGFATGNHIARENGQCNASSQVAGPIGIYFVLQSGSILGYQYMLFIIAIISLTLAIMNFLPIPALDGGRLWFTLVAHAIRRPMSARTEELVNAIGFLVLISLIILVSIVDVHRFF